jgi:hypothetical protein
MQVTQSGELTNARWRSQCRDLGTGPTEFECRELDHILRLKLESRQMHVAFIADRDQHHHDGVTSGTADDRARRAGVDAQLGDCGWGTAVEAASDDDGHLATEDGEQVAGDRIAVE